MKHAEEIMKILEAFDLTRSYRAAGELAGCDAQTVAHWVARRDAGELTATMVRRPQLIDEFLPKLEEWMEASHGKVRADIARDKIDRDGLRGLGAHDPPGGGGGAQGMGRGPSPGASPVGG